MYNEKFAKLYDELFYNDFSDSTFKNLILYINTDEVKTHLDLACGTGYFCKLMKTLGINSEGIDLSKEMLEEAKKRGIKVYNEDITNFKLNKKYDLITCNFDSINHLEKKDLRSFFKNVYDHLNDGGFFTFDFNNLKSLENLNEFKANFKEYTIITNNKVLANNKLEINIKIYNKNELVAENKVIETMFDNDYIFLLLNELSFNFSKFLNQDFSEFSNKKRTRFFVIK